MNSTYEQKRNDLVRDLCHKFEDRTQDSFQAQQNAMQAIDSLVQSEVRKVTLEKDIKYHTLKARYQRMFLGGETDAITTKKHVKRLKAALKEVKK